MQGSSNPFLMKFKKKRNSFPLLSLFSLFLFGFFLLSLNSNSSTSEPNSSVALVGGTLIDGTGAPPLPNAVIVFQEGLITKVGDKDNTDIPPDTKIVRLSGEAVLPGFINVHVHRGYNLHNLKAWAQGGVTAVRDLGGNPNNDLFGFRDKTLQDHQNARLVAAGPMVTVPEGYPMVPWGSSSGLPVTSSEDARIKVAKLLDDGADIIKLSIESGSSFNLKIPKLSYEEAKAIVDLAHDRGTLVSAHVLVSQDLEFALNVGVDDIAHMVTDSLPDSLIQRMVENKVYWVPTLELWFLVDPRLGEIAISNLLRFVQAGGLVAMGTDYAGYNAKFDLGMPIREINWMHKAGMSPMQIIIASTKNAAYVCNLAKSLGTLEQGKIADIIVVDGHPLEDLNHLLKVKMVYRNGILIRGRH